MSFYANGHPYFRHQHPGYNAPAPAASSPAPQFNFFAAHPRHHYNPFEAGPVYSPRHQSYSDLDEEERAALAHLRSIQQRRELAEAAAAREAADRARAQAEREASIRAAVERERQREAALAALIEERERRAEAAREERERRAEAARARKVAEAQRHREAYAAAIQRARESAVHQAQARAEWYNEALRRRAGNCAAKCARRSVEPTQTVSQHTCHPTCSCSPCVCRTETDCACRAAQQARAKATESAPQYKNELETLNSVLGSLFGLNIVPDENDNDNADNVEKVEKPTEVETPKQAEATPAPTAAPVPTTASEPKVTESATENENESDPTPAFPEDINSLLSQFLGLHVEPVSEDSTSAPFATGGVPKGLNDFLSNFGLVFEPDTPDSPEESAAAPAAGPSKSDESASSEPVATSEPQPERKPESKNTASNEETPLTSFLNGVTDLPPFVRDILGNIELGWKEQSQSQSQRATPGKSDKGKGVAPGEKKDAPTPAPAATPAPVAVPSPTPAADAYATPAETEDSTDTTASITQLDSIAHDLSLVRDSFTFPSTLSFGPSTSDSAPNLLFNKRNSGYHAQANKLLQLLLAADGVASGGDREVRRKRKELVRAVEAEIEELERKRDTLWEGVRDRREKGEVSEDEESVWSGSSVADHDEHKEFEHVENETEHAEHVESTPEFTSVTDNVTETIPVANDDSETKVEGFEVPAEAPKVETVETAEAVGTSTAAEPEAAPTPEQPVNAEPVVAAETEETEVQAPSEPAEQRDNKEDDFELL